MDKKVIFFLNYIWTAVIAFSFPICFELIFLHITGNTKGYGYALGSEKMVSVILGCIQFRIWLALSFPSYFYVFRKTAKKKIYLLISIALYIVLIGIGISRIGGLSVYLKDVFNARI